MPFGNRVSEKEQTFHTEDNDETEEPVWQRKKEATDHPANQIPDITFEKFSTHKRISQTFNLSKTGKYQLSCY